MAELNWKNVSGADMTSALDSVQRAERTMFDRTTGFTTGLQGHLNTMQQGNENAFKHRKNMNTQDVINQLLEADSQEDIQRLQQQGLTNGEVLRNKFGSEIDLNKINQVKSTWVADTENRATAADKLRDTTPEAKQRRTDIINLLQSSRQAEAESLIAQSQEIFSNQGFNKLIELTRKQRTDDRDYVLNAMKTEASVNESNARTENTRIRSNIELAELANKHTGSVAKAQTEQLESLSKLEAGMIQQENVINNELSSLFGLVNPEERGQFEQELIGLKQLAATDTAAFKTKLETLPLNDAQKRNITDAVNAQNTYRNQLNTHKQQAAITNNALDIQGANLLNAHTGGGITGSVVGSKGNATGSGNVRAGATINFGGQQLKLEMTRTVNVNGQPTKVAEINTPSGKGLVTIDSDGSVRQASEDVLTALESTNNTGNSFSTLKAAPLNTEVNQARNNLIPEPTGLLDSLNQRATSIEQTNAVNTAKQANPTKVSDINKLFDEQSAIRTNALNASTKSNVTGIDTLTEDMLTKDVFGTTDDKGKYKAYDNLEDFQNRGIELERQLAKAKSENVRSKRTGQLQYQADLHRGMTNLLNTTEFSGVALNEALPRAKEIVQASLNEQATLAKNTAINDYLGTSNGVGTQENRAIDAILSSTKNGKAPNSVKYNDSTTFVIGSEEQVDKTLANLSADLQQLGNTDTIDVHWRNNYYKKVDAIREQLKEAGSTVSLEDKKLVTAGLVKLTNKFVETAKARKGSTQTDEVTADANQFEEDVDSLSLFISRGRDNSKALSSTIDTIHSIDKNIKEFGKGNSYTMNKIAEWEQQKSSDGSRVESLSNYLARSNNDLFNTTTSSKVDFFESSPQLENKRNLTNQMINTGSKEASAILKDLSINPVYTGFRNARYVSGGQDTQSKAKADKAKLERPAKLEKSLQNLIELRDNGFIRPDDERLMNQFNLYNEVLSAQGKKTVSLEELIERFKK